jgi:hypothetical protein
LANSMTARRASKSVRGEPPASRAIARSTSRGRRRDPEELAGPPRPGIGIATASPQGTRFGRVLAYFVMPLSPVDKRASAAAFACSGAPVWSYCEATCPLGDAGDARQSRL